MNIHTTRPVRYAAAIALSIGGLVLTGGPAAARTVGTVGDLTELAATQNEAAGRHVRMLDEAPCRAVNSACSPGEVLASRYAAGGRITYR